MDIASLKNYMYKNNKIEFVLKQIGCHHIVYHPLKGYYSCANWNGDNVTAINVTNNKYINVRNWTRQKEFDDCSDIITLIQYNKQCSFIDAIKYLHKILELQYKGISKPNKITISEIEKEKNRLLRFCKCKKINVEEIRTIEEEALNDYIPITHIDWYREGIMPWTSDKFGLAYSYKRKRMIIPMRYWLTGELLGINSRTVIKNYNELGIKKYYLTPSYQKNLNLYGLYENYESIINKGQVIVYEAEKSVLKRDSLNDPTGVALSGHFMSDEQIRILLGLNVDIIIAMDKDVRIEEVRFMCEHFYRSRKVFYIYDKWDLLKEKDSPADASNKVFKYLLNHKIKYDEEEHKQFLLDYNNRKV